VFAGAGVTGGVLFKLPLPGLGVFGTEVALPVICSVVRGLFPPALYVSKSC
jgi:hypothetical protein